MLGVTLPGFGLGVLGASMGTALSQVVIAVVLTYILLVRSPELHLRRGENPDEHENRHKSSQCYRMVFL